MKALEKFLRYLQNLFWIRPTTQPLEPKATDMVDYYTCVNYKGQWVNLRTGDEVDAFDNLSRKEKRAMAQRTAVLVKKGKLRFVEIDGKMTCVKNKDYGQSRDKSGEGKAGSRK
jgi:hypothetical protein